MIERRRIGETGPTCHPSIFPTENTTMPRKMFAAIALASASAAAMAAGPAGSVDAALVVDNQVIRLDHVLVVQSGNEEVLDEPGLRIYLSTAEMPLSVGGGASTLRAQSWARKAGITAVVLHADPTTKAWPDRRACWRHPA